MAQGRGSKAQLRMYYEAVYGTPPPAGNGVRLPAVDIAIGAKQDLVQSRVLQGNRSMTMPARDQRTVTGGTTIQPDVRSIGWLLYQLFGGYAVAGPVGGLYTHTFTINTLPIGVTLEKFFSDLGFALQYAGSRINGVSWDIGTGGLQEVGFDWVSQDEIYSATPIDATPLLSPVVGFRVPSVTLSQAGISLITATKFGMAFSNNLDPVRTVGNGGLINSAPEGLFGATFNMDVTFDGMTQYNKARNSTEETVVVTYPAVQAGMSLQLLMDEVQYSMQSPGVPGPGGLTVPMNGQAYYDDAAAGSALRALLINDQPTYAAIP